MIATCANPVCEKSFNTKPGSPAKYCSKQCYWIMKSHGDTILICAGCGAEFTRNKAVAKRGKIHFCSNECRDLSKAHHAHRRKRVTIRCDYCNQEVETIPYRANLSNKHFCNKRCHAKWVVEFGPHGENHPLYSRVVVNCENCGEKIFREKKYASLYDHIFCNVECAGEWTSINRTGTSHPNWKGGYPGYRGPNWRKQRDATRKRDNYTCQRCGKEEIEVGRRLDIHHIRPFLTFGYIIGENDHYKEANDLGNLIALCPECHHIVERETVH